MAALGGLVSAQRLMEYSAPVAHFCEHRKDPLASSPVALGILSFGVIYNLLPRNSELRCLIGMRFHQHLVHNIYRMSKTLGVLFLLITVTVIARADKVDDYIKAEMHRNRIPGLSLAIVRDSKVVRATGYGFANVELSVPAAENTVYQIGSITKQFTATMVMMLVVENKVRLDDKITARISNLPASWSDVTIRQLLTHTSGIKDYTEVEGFERRRRVESTQAELLELVETEKLQFTPGEEWRYCNTNYLLLGMLIEQVTGKKYYQFLFERILKPLGMTQTHVNDRQAIIANRATGYIRIPGNLQNAPYFSPANAFGAGDLISTVEDMVKWDAALYSERLLKASSLEEMWTPVVLSKGGTAEYGFGWDVKSENGHRLIAHGGNITGFSCGILRFVNDKLTVIVLTNFGSINAEAIAQGVAAQIQPELAKKIEEPIVDPDPKTTELIRRAFKGMMIGEMDHHLFGEQLNRELGPKISQGKEQAKVFNSDNGPMEKFEILEMKATDQGMQLRYRAVFEYRRMIVYAGLDKAGKITNWGVRGEP